MKKFWSSFEGVVLVDNESLTILTISELDKNVSLIRSIMHCLRVGEIPLLDDLPFFEYKFLVNNSFDKI